MAQPPPYDGHGQGNPPGGGFGPAPGAPQGGGFGAPQGPYGAPQPGPYSSGPYQPPAQPSQPPAQPAQPPTPPQPPQGYGYPQAGPYAAQPPGPYGNPPQGYGYPPPQPPGPGTPGRAKKPALVIGAAVAALLVIGGTVYAVTGGGDDKKPVAQESTGPDASASPSSSDDPVNPGDGDGDGKKEETDLNAGRKAGEAKVLWYKEAPDTPADGADAPGMWFTGQIAVKAAYKQLLAYKAADGTSAWPTLTLPQKICAATRQQTADGKIVVAYMSGVSSRAQCNQLQQIDLRTGAKGWTAKVPDGKLFDSASDISLTLAGDTVMVGRSQSGIAYDVRTGKSLYEKEKYGDACFPSAFAASANRLISVASCDALGTNEHTEIQELTPATGAVKWTRPLDKGWEVERTFSVDPLVVYSTHDDKNLMNIAAFKADGSVRSQVGFDLKIGTDCGWDVFHRDLMGCGGTATDANTLYLPTDSGSGPNEIVAVDLATGKEKWRAKSPGEGPMQPIRMDAGNLIAYVEPSYDTPGQVLSIPTAGTSHTPTKLLQLPASTTKIENGFSSRDIAWTDNRLYLSTTRITGNDDTRQKLMLVYGK
ncbi:PQQ-binding-like beta-propeller repeat protein [Streptomyces sp. NPDC004539]|uniref:outer membrane protein assembly factor BamB family protein n=1 Tax=Streptomyces sp. NPDC004539 TaxID=3154280 RepID=UPI0033AD0CB5